MLLVNYAFIFTYLFLLQLKIDRNEKHIFYQKQSDTPYYSCQLIIVFTSVSAMVLQSSNNKNFYWISVKLNSIIHDHTMTKVNLLLNTYNTNSKRQHTNIIIQKLIYDCITKKVPAPPQTPISASQIVLMQENL